MVLFGFLYRMVEEKRSPEIKRCSLSSWTPRHPNPLYIGKRVTDRNWGAKKKYKWGQRIISHSLPGFFDRSNFEVCAKLASRVVIQCLCRNKIIRGITDEIWYPKNEDLLHVDLNLSILKTKSVYYSNLLTVYLRPKIK